MRRVGVPSDALLRMPLELRYAGGFALRALRLPAPLGLLGGLLAARGVPFGERLGAVRFVLALRRRRFRLEQDCTVDELLARHAQEGSIARHLWRPLCVSALNTPPERAAAGAFLAVLRDTLGGAAGASDLLLPRVDLSRLFPEPAAALACRARRRAAAQRARARPRGPAARARGGGGRGRSAPARGARACARAGLRVPADLHDLPSVPRARAPAAADARPGRGARAVGVRPRRAARRARQAGVRDQRAGRSPADGARRSSAPPARASWRRRCRGCRRRSPRA